MAIFSTLPEWYGSAESAIDAVIMGVVSSQNLDILKVLANASIKEGKQAILDALVEEEEKKNA